MFLSPLSFQQPRCRPIGTAQLFVGAEGKMQQRVTSRLKINSKSGPWPGRGGLCMALQGCTNSFYQHTARTVWKWEQKKGWRAFVEQLGHNPPPVYIKDNSAARQVHCLGGLLAKPGMKKLRHTVISTGSTDVTFYLPIPSKDICNSAFWVLQINTCSLHFLQAWFVR